MQHSRVGWLDPAVDSDNDGDLIIADSVGRELTALDIETVRLPTHRRFTDDEARSAGSCHRFIVGGTNLLNSHPARYRQWALGTRELRIMRGSVILMGVGWWQYEDPPDALARGLMRWILSPSALHSVRDSYTASRVGRVRQHVINTSCPTIWNVPRTGAARHGFRETVIATVTDYHRDPDRDRRLLVQLRDRSQNLAIWPQGAGDVDYVTSLGFGGHLAGRGLETLDALLDEPGAEYVGTRLHAGIRALQHDVGAVVLSVDNRATEIGKDTGLWVVEGADVADLDGYLDQRSAWSLTLPDDAIESWRASLINELGIG